MAEYVQRGFRKSAIRTPVTVHSTPGPSSIPGSDLYEYNPPADHPSLYWNHLSPVPAVWCVQ